MIIKWHVKNHRSHTGGMLVQRNQSVVFDTQNSTNTGGF